MPTTETILLETVLVDHAPPLQPNNPFKKAKMKRKRDDKPPPIGTVQLIERKYQEPKLAGEAAPPEVTTYFLRFIAVRVSNERHWPLYVLLSRTNAPLAVPGKRGKRDEEILKTLEAQGEIVPLDIGPDGQWIGAQLPMSFEQQLFVFDPLVFKSVVICKPSAARPPSVLPFAVAHGVFESYLPPQKTPAQIQAELDALEAKMKNTVMEMESGALQGDVLDLEALQRSAKELFKLFDQDRSNSIDFDEYKQMLAYRGLKLLDSKAMRLFQLVDDQKKGFIDEHEFVIALYITNALRVAEKREKATPQVLSPLDVFYQLDRDRDGLLNVFEFEKAMQLLGVKASVDQIKARFPKGSSTISMDQFTAAWLDVVDLHEELRKRGIPTTSIDAEGPAPADKGSGALGFLSRSTAAKKEQSERDRLKQNLLAWLTKVEQEELAQALQAKDEVCRLEKARREQAQEEKRALFAQQRHTETETRTIEALRERQEKIQRRKERVIKEKQAREEKRLLSQMADEREKRTLHQRQVVQELMATKMDKITTHKARHGDDILDLSFRQLAEVPGTVYRGRDAITSLGSLLIVSLAGNRLKELPTGIFTHLILLQVLDISENEIDQLPPEIGEARDLRRLDARDNRLSTLPLQLKMLQQLQVLNLSHNQLEHFGDLPVADSLKRDSYCTALSALEELDLSYNDQLVTLSESIGDLAALKMLRLRGCTVLKRVPDSLHKLANLLIFSMSGAQYKRFSKGVFGPTLKSLRMVDMSFNTLASLPETLGNVPNIQQLVVAHNQLTSVPSHVAGLKELVEFDGSSNKIDKLHDRIGELKYLEVLDLSRNLLCAPLPPTLGLLTSLHTLRLHHNKLQAVPMEFGALINVQDLDLSWNQLVSLPDEIGCLASLRRLNLSHNKLVTLPETVLMWQELETFQCSHNALASPLTPSMEALARLRYVDLSHNVLTQLDSCLSRLPSVEVLNVAGNKLKLLPSELATAPAAASLRKLDLYNNRILAIPVEWSSLLSQLDVFSIGRNPMSLLPEKWSDHWRGQRWRHGDLHTSTGTTNGYTPTQVKEWVHDQSRVYPIVLATWKQHPTAIDDGSDAFVDKVRATMGEDDWQQRFERIVRYYFYEFKHVGHEVLFESVPQDQHEAFNRTEQHRRHQQGQRADEAIATNNAFREKLAEAYAYDTDAVKAAMDKRRREYHVTSIKGVQQEARQWNDVVHEKLPEAHARHDAVMRERKRRFAAEMKAIARQRVERKYRLENGGDNDPRPESDGHS